MSAKLIYLTDEEFNLLVVNLTFGSTTDDRLNIHNKLLFIRDKFEEKEMPTKQLMTRIEAIDL